MSFGQTQEGIQSRSTNYEVNALTSNHKSD